MAKYWLNFSHSTARLGRGGLEPLEGRSLPSSEAEIERAAGGLGGEASSMAEYALLPRVGRYPRARQRVLRGFEEASVGSYHV